MQHNPTGADPGDPYPHLNLTPDVSPEPDADVTVGAEGGQAELAQAVSGATGGAAAWTDPDVTQVVRVRADHPAGVAQPAGTDPAALPDPGHDRSADVTQFIAASGPGWTPPAPSGGGGS